METEQRPHLEVAAWRLEVEQSVILHEFSLGALQRHTAAVRELCVPLACGPVEHYIARMVVEDYALGTQRVPLLEGRVEPMPPVCRKAVDRAEHE